MIAPKCPGHRLRELFQEGIGVPALLAVEQDASGHAERTALAYAKGLGSLKAGVIREPDLFQFLQEHRDAVLAQQVLVDANGMTLYYLTSDTATTSACTGGCAGFWPPLLASGTPTAPSLLAGKLTVVKTANGSQVSYNGHLLYRYAPDTKPGDAGGDGKTGPQNGTWHVATPVLKVM
jgi:predicted lipoprotein with Yx(FWY)xxD motif